jgi:hypothetical protein
VIGLEFRLGDPSRSSPRASLRGRAWATAHRLDCNLPDRPIIVAYLLVIVVMFIVINLLVDVLYSALDPRVRLTE